MWKVVLKRNLANMITMTRIALAIIIFCYTSHVFYNSRNIVFYSLLYVIAWVSDFIDGRVARRLGISSKTGGILDLLADSFFVFLLNIQLIVMKLIPFFFFFVLAEKIFNYVITSKVRSNVRYSRTLFWNDRIGRIVSASFLVIPWIVITFYDAFQGGGRMMSYSFLICIVILSIISSMYRYYETYRVRKIIFEAES